MYIVDFSDKTIRYIHFKKSLLGKYEIKDCGIVDTNEVAWEERLNNVIKSQKIALVIPESASKIVRFEVGKDEGEDELKKGVEARIAEDENIDTFAFDCGIKRKNENTSDVMCLAAHYQEIAPIFSLVQQFDAKPTLAVPESLAVFRILRDGIIEGEIILLLDLEDEQMHFVFYDSTGPLLKKSYPSDLPKLDKITNKVVEEFIASSGLEVNRIVLNGVGSTRVEPYEFRKSVNILTIKAEDILKDRLSKLNLHFECGGENVGRYLNAIATGLMTQEASSLNLVKNDVLMNVEKYAMTHQFKKEKDTEDEKNDEEKDEVKSTSKRPHLMAEPIEEDKDEPSNVERSQDEEKEEVEVKFERKEPMNHTIGSPDSQFRSSFRSDEEKSGGGAKKKILLFLVVALVVAVIAGVALYLLGGSTTSPVVEEETTEEPTPTATPTPELDREDLSLQVLNGSGEPGLAGDVASALEDLGYQEGIDTDNAESYDYDETVIQLKEEFADYFDTLKKDLENEGYVVADDYEELDEDSDYDGVVIVGSLNEDQAEETEDEEVTPTPEEE